MAVEVTPPKVAVPIRSMSLKWDAGEDSPAFVLNETGTGSRIRCSGDRVSFVSIAGPDELLVDKTIDIHKGQCEWVVANLKPGWYLFMNGEWVVYVRICGETQRRICEITEKIHVTVTNYTPRTS